MKINQSKREIRAEGGNDANGSNGAAGRSVVGSMLQGLAGPLMSTTLGVLLDRLQDAERRVGGSVEAYRMLEASKTAEIEHAVAVVKAEQARTEADRFGNMQREIDRLRESCEQADENARRMSASMREESAAAKDAEAKVDYLCEIAGVSGFDELREMIKRFDPDARIAGGMTAELAELREQAKSTAEQLGEARKVLDTAEQDIRDARAEAWTAAVGVIAEFMASGELPQIPLMPVARAMARFHTGEVLSDDAWQVGRMIRTLEAYEPAVQLRLWYAYTLAEDPLEAAAGFDAVTVARNLPALRTNRHAVLAKALRHPAEFVSTGALATKFWEYVADVSDASGDGFDWSEDDIRSIAGWLIDPDRVKYPETLEGIDSPWVRHARPSLDFGRMLHTFLGKAATQRGRA